MALLLKRLLKKSLLSFSLLTLLGSFVACGHGGTDEPNPGEIADAPDGRGPTVAPSGDPNGEAADNPDQAFGPDSVEVQGDGGGSEDLPDYCDLEWVVCEGE